MHEALLRGAVEDLRGNDFAGKDGTGFNMLELADGSESSFADFPLFDKGCVCVS